MNFRIFYGYLFLPLFGFGSNFQPDPFNNDSEAPQQVQSNVQHETPAHAQLDSEINSEACIEIDTLPLLCKSGNIDTLRTYKINAALDVVETMLQQNTPNLSMICCAVVQQKDGAAYVQFIEASSGIQPKLHFNISPCVSVIVFNDQCTTSTLRNLPSVKLLFANTVTSIRKNQFQECQNLDEVIIPSTITGIGCLAFYQSSVRQVEILPGNFSVLKLSMGIRMTPPVIIGQKAFNFCSQLTKVNIRSMVIILYEEAFANCQQLKEVCLPFFSCRKRPKNRKDINNIKPKIFSGTNVKDIIFCIPDIPLRDFYRIITATDIDFNSAAMLINRNVAVSNRDAAPATTPQEILDLSEKTNIQIRFQEYFINFSDKSSQEEPVDISLPFTLDNPGDVFKFLADFLFNFEETQGKMKAVPKKISQMFHSLALLRFFINSLLMAPEELLRIYKDEDNARYESLIWLSQALRWIAYRQMPSTETLPIIRKCSIGGILDFFIIIENFKDISMLRVLMNNDIGNFQNIISQTNTKIDDTIVNLAIFFHANNIVKYAIMQGFDVKPSTLKTAIFSQNIDCIHLCSPDDMADQVWLLAFGVHNSDIVQFLLEKLSKNDSDLKNNSFFFNGMIFDQSKLFAITLSCLNQYLDPEIFDNFVVTFENDETGSSNVKQVDGRADDNAAGDHSSCKCVVRYFSKKLTENEARNILTRIQDAVERAQRHNIKITSIMANVQNGTEISDDAQNLLKSIDLDDENSNEHTILPITLQTMDANQLTF